MLPELLRQEPQPLPERPASERLVSDQLGSAAPAMACSSGTLGAAGGAGLRAARFSRSFLRFSIFFSFSSMRTLWNFITRSDTRKRRSTSSTVSGLVVNCSNT